MGSYKQAFARQDGQQYQEPLELYHQEKAKGEQKLRNASSGVQEETRRVVFPRKTEFPRSTKMEAGEPRNQAYESSSHLQQKHRPESTRVCQFYGSERATEVQAIPRVRAGTLHFDTKKSNF